MELIMDIIPIASDHAGFSMKEYIKKNLEQDGYTFEDYGTVSDDPVDYPDMIHPLAKDIDNRKYKKGIAICGSGNGAAIVANKYRNVRAALCWEKEIVSLARRHNDSNVIVLPARFISNREALKFVKIFFSTSFEGGRHKRRVDKITGSL
jgi:ribose 5-phosphate isomerase B